MAQFEPKKFGRYVLIDKLAVGGMAEIYKAKTYGVDGFEKLLAIKRILPHCSADAEFVTMLVDEAKLTVLLSHANIVQVYDLGKVEDDYYISMEFIQGTNLRELMKRVTDSEGKLPEELAVYIVSELGKGLDYAHRKADTNGEALNIVHRDINPQNCLISFEGEVKIVDFGIAKAAMNVSHTMAGVLKGKIAYMSPEQALGKPLDGRTDIYSAGLVLYEMLTGEKLFTGETQFEVLNKIRTTHVNTMDLPEDIAGPLKAILAKSLAYNPKDRYSSAGDLHLELTKYLYSSYIDFSPRQLSALVRKYFTDDIKAAEERGPEIDEKTRSLLIKTGSMDTLVSEEAAKDMPPPPTDGETDAAFETETTEPAPVVAPAQAEAVRRKKPKRGLSRALLAIAVVAAGGYLAWGPLGLGDKVANIFTGGEPTPAEIPPPVEPPPPEFGSITVSSEPTNAKILLNGENTRKTTPATLPKLALGTDYSIEVVKEHYEPYKKTVSLDSEDPVKLHTSLKILPDGVLSVVSEPPGAKIFLDGKDTEKVTPSKLEGLEIEKRYAIKLQKEGYIEWAGTVPVKDFDEVEINATLQAAPKAPEKPKAPAVKMGSLEVRSTPGNSQVYLNGSDTGKVTPTQLEKLEIGKFYTIKLVKPGYKDWTKSVKLNSEAEKMVASLSATGAVEKKPERTKAVEKPRSTPTPTPKRRETTPPPPVYSPAPAPAPTRTIPSTPVYVGKPATLEVKSSPSGAEVYVNSQYKGTTPVKVSGLSAGSASVKLVKYGYIDYSRSVTLKAGERTKLGTIKLEDLYGELKIESRPPRAEVIFDGKKIGATTPVTIRKVPRNRSHTVQVILNGYRPWSSSVDMSRQKNTKLNVTLQRQ